MIPLLSREAVRAVDADAVARLGVASCILMENAGRGAFDQLREHYPTALDDVLIIGGVGQNGGDAWVVARHLILHGHRPRCVLVGDRAKVAGDALPNLISLERLNGAVLSIGNGNLAELEPLLRSARVIVDGLFGTGLDRPVSGLYATVIERINAADAPRIALDIPSGIDADSGKVLGVAIKAALTVTFAAHKRGLHQHPGAAHVGELVCVGIGVPVPGSSDYAVIEASDVAAALPLRAADTHKGRGGHVLVIAGAPGRTGAAVLAGHAALRAGAGLVTLCPRAGARAALDAKVLELMTVDLPAELEAAVGYVIEQMRTKHAAVIGPGLGTDEEGATLARRLALELEKPCVLDADALTAFSGRATVLRAASGPRILTPHPAEAARILEQSTEQVQADRYAAATRLATMTGAVVVLKGARTVVAEPGGQVRVCPLDVPALAVAGTGDVLAGIVTTLVTQLDPFTAAATGVYLHALAGKRAAQADRGLFAHEVADACPAALASCRHAAPHGS
ncbi:MAG: NAD(P)H-hydrate dehydratase [Polyangiales bacterium]